MSASPTENPLKKWQKFLAVIPQVLGLFWVDGRDYVLRLYVRVSWRKQGLSIASTARLHYEQRSQIEIKGRCSIGNYSVIAVATGKDLICSPLLIIGENTYVGDQVNIRAVGGIIQIGNNVLIANQVTIVASNHGILLGKFIIEQDWRRGDVLIEDDVWIGAGVVILAGAIIRHGAIIAAGAVVRGEIPSCTIYGGIPARQISIRS